VWTAILAVGAVAIFAAGPAPQLIFAADVANYLDGCHRVSLGQVLGADFSSPIGPAALLPCAVMMRINGADIHALVGGSVLVWLGFGLLSWLAVGSRLPSWLAAGFALFVAATAAAPYTLDFGSWRTLSYGLLYNRLAWSALCVAAAVALLPRRDLQPARMVAVGLGACAAWLWLLKPNFLLVLVPLLVCDWRRLPGEAAWFARVGIGAAGTLLVVWVLVPFAPLAYAADHIGMARNAPADLLGYTFSRSIVENMWIVAALIAIWGATLLTFLPSASRSRAGWTVCAIIVTTFAANLTNCSFAEFPLWGALGWIAAGVPSAGGMLARCCRVAGLAIGLGFTWQPLAGLGYNFLWKAVRSPGVPPSVAVAGPAWLGLPMRPVPGQASHTNGPLENPANYALWINDGLALVARHSLPPGPVLSLDWNNPFPFALGREPARGDNIAWHVGRTVGPKSHPDPRVIAAEAIAIMEPKRSLQPDSLAFKRTIFAEILASSYHLAGESDQWRLWLRHPPGVSPEANHR